MPVDVEQCYRHVIFFYPFLLHIYGLLGNVVTLKKNKQTKWGGCDNIVIAWHCHSLVGYLHQSLVLNKVLLVEPPFWIRACLYSFSSPNKNPMYNLLQKVLLLPRHLLFIRALTVSHCSEKTGESNFWWSAVARYRNFKSPSFRYPLEPDVFPLANSSSVNRTPTHAMAVVTTCVPMKTIASTLCCWEVLVYRGQWRSHWKGLCTIVLAV